MKVPKLWQIFGKKIGLGKLRASHSEDTVSNATERPTERQWAHGEFKRATDVCGKFKITETQNKNSESLYSGKVQKIRQMFGKLDSG